MKTGVEIIADERARQVSQEGWTPEHDNQYRSGEPAFAALGYAELGASISRCHMDFNPSEIYPHPRWPWHKRWWKPSDDPVRNLAKAGALIAAEIDRLNRVVV